MHLQRVEHALARDDDLLGLLLDGQRPDEGRDLRGASRCPKSRKLEKETTHESRQDAAPRLLGRLPLRELAQSFLPRPDGRVHDFEEQLPRPRVEDEDRAVDGLGREVALEGLVDRHAVDLRVSLQLKRGHDAPLMGSTEWSEPHVTQTPS